MRGAGSDGPLDHSFEQGLYRITDVVGSSSGTPVAAPIRFSSPDFDGETTNYDTTKRDWFLESLKGYFGREDEVPADGHYILAMIAPRRCLLATALSDGSGDATYAVERNAGAAAAAYSLLGASDHLRVRWREGRDELEDRRVLHLCEDGEAVLRRGPNL